MDGVIVMMKPAGWTSHDVVAKARRILGIKRIGHTGTLDPEVTGVLPLCIGRATRLVEYIQDLPKEYAAELTIGYATDTEDTSGNIVEKSDRVSVTREKAEAVLRSFVGAIEQTPPMYSAVKVNGKRLYEWARQGKEVERNSRKVHIYEIELLEFQHSFPYPKIRFRVKCSKGTYIRTLCKDIGQALGYPSVMSGLVRTTTGNFRLEQCITIEQLEQIVERGELAASLIPPDQAVKHFPQVTVAEAFVQKALNGQKLPLSALGNFPAEGGKARLYTEQLVFLGIYDIRSEDSAAVPLKLFH
ncbi:tRNA pseudouridine(55) synthase TruB [Ferviditalea candida]|uniref:tRNA pseudouridine synthase B n=1 Tax=Ferviditalea candida TaxID=3108399 RepID=A0ABU5ZHH1_9BACL|nr:tRNA pseudouridine(55) synthase TruB [Paenibacillaceae bacterium T2]